MPILKTIKDEVILEYNDTSHLKDLIQSGKYNMCEADFAYTYLNGIDFRNIPIDNANFSNAEVINCDFSNGHFMTTSSRLVNVTFKNCNFSNITFNITQFLDNLDSDFTIINSTFCNCNFKNTNLEHTHFESCNFNGSNFERAYFYNSAMYKCDLRFTSLRYAKLDNLIISDDCKFNFCLGDGKYIGSIIVYPLHINLIKCNSSQAIITIGNMSYKFKEYIEYCDKHKGLNLCDEGSKVYANYKAILQNMAICMNIKDDE